MKKMIFKSVALLAAFLGLAESADAQATDVQSQVKVSAAAKSQLQNKVLNTNPNAYFMKEGPIFVKDGAIANPGANVGREVFVKENGPSFVKSGSIANPAETRGVFVKESGPTFVKSGAISRPNVRVVRPGGGN
jgi:hypothetical protein